MKKAGIAAKAKEKLNLFKAGRLQLENVILKDNAKLCSSNNCFIGLIHTTHDQRNNYRAYIKIH